MLPKDIMSLIQEIEDKFPVHYWHVNNIPVWTFLRIELGLYCFFKETKEKKNQFKNRLNQGSNFFKTFLFYLRYKQEKMKPADVFCLSDGLAYIHENNQDIDPFFDPIQSFLKELGYSSQKMTQVQIPFLNLKTPPILMNPFLKIWFKLKAKYDVPNEVKLDQHEELRLFLEQKGLFCTWFSKKKLFEYVAILSFWKAFFIKKLQIISPKKALVVNYFNQPGFGLIWACKALNIPVAEVQHGAAGPLHYAYAKWRQQSLLLPDYFLCWTKEDAQLVNEGLGKGGIFLGVPMIAYQKHHDISVSDTEKFFLFSLQVHAYSDHFIRLLIEIIEKTPQYSWIIRRHPAQQKESDIEWALKQKPHIKNYEIQYPKPNPLHRVLPYVRLHLTHSSSIILDAKLWGIPTLILDPAGTQYYDGYINDKNPIIFSFQDFQKYKNSTVPIQQQPTAEEMKSLLLKFMTSA